jgi:hypothetical protein
VAKTRTTTRTTKVARTEPTGEPVCIAALFCDSVVTGDDKRLTLVRSLDTINLPPGTTYKSGEPLEFGAQMVILLKQANAVGDHDLLVTVQGPHPGDSDVLGVLRANFTADADQETGHNFISPIRLVWRGAGLYWFHLQTKARKVIAKTALRIRNLPDPLAEIKTTSKAGK